MKKRIRLNVDLAKLKKLRAQNLTNQQIADELGIGVRALSNQVTKHGLAKKQRANPNRQQAKPEAPDIARVNNALTATQTQATQSIIEIAIKYGLQVIVINGDRP